MFAMRSPARAGVPGGPYQSSCQFIQMVGTTLVAGCTGFFGNTITTTLPDAAQCKGAITNVDGTLRCVMSSMRSESGRDTFNIISEPTTTTSSGGSTTVWRIDHPDVIALASSYPQITFKPGDQITFAAGGCVQTGGMGATWKSYVYPTGDNAAQYYSGLMWIPGVTGGGLQRDAGLVNKKLTVGAHLAPAVVSQLFLHLGYQDDGPGDNGYYSHDNGNNNQCLNVGPAWVQLSVFRPNAPPKPVGVSWAPWKKPFDLTWNVNVAGDDNGFPLNPTWGYQVDHPKDKPDFGGICGSSFSGSDEPFHGNDTVHDGTLAANCTTQLPTTDFYTGVFSVFTLCNQSGAEFDGHLNWAFATYTGNLQWRNYSGGWPQDGDYNLGILDPADAAQTKDSDGNYPGLGMEFDAKETIDNFGSPWWKSFGNDSDAQKSATVDGQPATIVGLVGIDGVHGGYTEVHPVLAMAVLTGEKMSGDGVDETWAFFIRNQGDEGECSENEHLWNGLAGAYALQVQWPKDATKVSLAGSSSDVWTSWKAGVSGPTLEQQSPWTYVEFSLPSPTSSSDGIDGTFTLHYTLKDPAKHTSRRMTLAAAPARAEEADVDWDEIAAKISDPTTRGAFTTQLRAAPALALAPHTIQLKFPGTIAAHHARSDPSRKGQLTRDSRVPSPLYKAQTTALNALYTRYAPDFPAVKSP
ncbi:MAG TPA: hypothetical protein VMD91_15570 [Candidatus Sulfotelmatobacter sp.]|nr:hypothetical protein [Candidatus Sulfotelmatobacter sp.]